MPSGQYCILHAPQKNKDLPSFNKAVQKFLAADKSDFRYVHFPDGYSFGQENKPFPAIADFTDSVFYSELNLAGATLPHGLTLRAKEIKTIRLSNASVIGDITIEVQGSVETINFESAIIDAAVSLNIADRVNNILFHGAQFKRRIMLKAGNVTQLSFNAPSTVINDILVEVKEKLSFFEGTLCHFQSDVTVKANTLEKLSLAKSRIDGMLTVQHGSGLNKVQDKSIIGINLSGATLGRGVNLSGCNIKTYSAGFQNANFTDATELILDRAVIDGDLTIIASPIPPKSVMLAGCIVTGETKICSELRQPLIEIIAKVNRPEFFGNVLLSNVSLRECRLVGNPIDKITLSNIRWTEVTGGRAVLYDETELSSNSTLSRNIQGAYQVLKEKYRQLGDHSLSGDFHFGEMEMKRREVGFFKRNLGWEAWYYYLSGYGTRPLRAMLCLLYLLVLFTCIFTLWGDPKVENNVQESFLFTMQAATFQPLSADQAQWTGETRLMASLVRVVVPLQAGLLALAIRMRLKR